MTRAPRPARDADADADARTDTIARPAAGDPVGRERSRTARTPSGARRSSPADIAASATTSRIPTTPRPRAAHAVFVDGSGRRARRLQAVVVLVAVVGALFVGVVAASALSGPSGPVGPAGAPAPRVPAATPTTPVPSNAVVEILPTTTPPTTTRPTTARPTPSRSAGAGGN